HDGVASGKEIAWRRPLEERQHALRRPGIAHSIEELRAEFNDRRGKLPATGDRRPASDNDRLPSRRDGVGDHLLALDYDLVIVLTRGRMHALEPCVFAAGDRFCHYTSARPMIPKPAPWSALR